MTRNPITPDAQQQFVLQPDHGPDITFQGELVGHADSYSDDQDRWSDFTLYRTRGGILVGAKARYTKDSRDPVKLECKVLETDAQVIAYFGDRWLAKELYDDAGIDYSLRLS